MSSRRGYFETMPSGKGMLFYLSFFHEECVRRLKDEIPSAYRGWDDEEQAWWISDKYVDEAEGIVSEFFDEG